jgi:hypothetical protein
MSNLRDSALELTDVGKRLDRMQELKRELQHADRPLIGVAIYQKELAGRVDVLSGVDPRSIAADELPEISISYELAFMREPNFSTGERACRAGKRCDTLRISKEFGMEPWVMREFLFPEQVATFEATRERPVRAQLCVFCMKKNAFMHYIFLKYQRQDARVIVQPYRNKCDVPGEFASTACIHPATDRFYGIIAPFAHHNLNMYTMELDNATNLRFAAYTDVTYFHSAPVVHDDSPH